MDVPTQTERREPPGLSEPAVGLRGGPDAREWRVHPPTGAHVAEIVNLLRQRRLWRDVPGTTQRIADRCVAVLQELSLSPSDLEALAAAGTLEVSIPAPLVNAAAASTLPWEFVIAEATRRYRQTGAMRRSLLIARHLATDAAPSLRPATLGPGRRERAGRARGSVLVRVGAERRDLEPRDAGGLAPGSGRADAGGGGP